MKCTMPNANHVPVEPAKSLEYVFNCLEEAFRGLIFTGMDRNKINKLKKKIADVSCEVGDALRYT